MSKYSPFLNKQVVIVLRGETSFGFVTPEGKQVQTNSFFGYLIAEDSNDLWVSVDNPKEHTALINKSEVALLSMAPDSDDIIVDFTPDFDDTELN